MSSDPNRKWEFNTADSDLPAGFKGSRADAVAEANELTEIAGKKVYVQTKGAGFTPATPYTKKR